MNAILDLVLFLLMLQWLQNVKMWLSTLPLPFVVNSL